MRVPEVLFSLTDQGIIDEVVRPLKSGKEAHVFLVRAGGEVRVAKVYKDAQQRSFKQRAQYTEGRRVRNTRDQRAMDRRTRHGKSQEEDAWKSAEVDVIYRLHAQGVRVPTPYNFIDGVLIMELVCGDDGHPAPRLSELTLDGEAARSLFDQLLREVVKMLCAGIVHGDLSDYNVLVDTAGPVIIDFPQSVDAAKNRNARRLLVRDVDNLSAFLTRHVPSARRRPYGQEIWSAYESNLLTPDLDLTGRFRRSNKVTNMGALLEEIEEAEQDERRRRQASGEAGLKPRRREVIIAPSAKKPDREGGRRRKRGSRGGSGHGASASQGPGGDDRRKTEGSGAAGGGDSVRASAGEGAPKRRRRRRRGGGSAKGNQGDQPPQRSDTASGQASAPPSSVPPPNPEADSDAPRSRKRRRRRRRKGRDPGAGDATSSGSDRDPRRSAG